MQSRTALLPALCLATSLGCGVSYPPTSGRVESQTVRSTAVGDSYLIEVRLPPGYDSDPTRRYPTVYQLDGTSFGPEFAVTAGAASDLESSGAIPPCIVVGVGYPYEDPLVSTTQGRGRDFATTFGNGKPGGAENFFAFLHTELIPLIESRYRAAADRRVLSGHSMGGFFALHTLFTRGDLAPPPFLGYIASDPSLGEDDLRLFTEEAALAQRAPGVTAPLWLPIARYDGAVQQLYHHLLVGRLRSHFAALPLGTEILDTDHPGSIEPGFRRGLVHTLGGAR